MKQRTPLKNDDHPAKSKKERVATRNMVGIGQRWQERTRRREKTVVWIRQVHRVDKEVEAEVIGVGAMDPVANLERQREIAAEVRAILDAHQELVDKGAVTHTQLPIPSAYQVVDLADELTELVQDLDAWRLQDGFDPYAGRPMRRIKFVDLRAKYRPLEPNQLGGQG